ncbi:MAG: hypothetical protein KC493_12125 [Bacteriovoracaceae bacterium]|nr:hypothetical protein [Bacteriovoracaceae bacterium]
MNDEKKIKVAWIGKETTFFKDMKNSFNEKMANRPVEWYVYNLDKENVGELFIDNTSQYFNWIFFDLTLESHYKLDIIKVIKKYSCLSSISLVAIVSKEGELEIKEAVDLPVQMVSIVKKEVEDIVEDVLFLSESQEYNPEHFKTLGFDQVLWSLFPVTLSFDDDETIVLHNKQAGLEFMGELKSEIKGLETELDERTSRWLGHPDTAFKIFMNSSSESETFNTVQLKVKDEKYQLKVRNERFKKLKEKFKCEDKDESDERKRVLIYDTSMRFFNRCWGDSQSEEKVNMYNFPYFSKDYNILEEIYPDLIMINVCKTGKEYFPDVGDILSLILKVQTIENYDPLIVVFNSKAPQEDVEYSRLLEIDLHMTDDFIEKMFDLLVNNDDFKVGDLSIKESMNSKCPRKFKKKHTVFVEVPILLKELSENYIKVKTTFNLVEPVTIYENSEMGALITLSEKAQDGSDKEYTGVFVAENESQKTRIRKYVNKLNFIPKTAEQLKELMEFIELNARVKMERDEAWQRLLEEEGGESISEELELSEESVET